MLSATDISQIYSPASLKLLADALLSAAKQGKSQADPADLIKLLLSLPEIKKIYANRQ